MIRLRSILFVIFVVSITRISGDICDVCVCSKNECVPADESGACMDVEEFFTCNGIEGDGSKSHDTFDINNIQWPNRNVSISVKFNHFKTSYLTNLICTVSSPLLSPVITTINLDSNFIERIESNPFKFCRNLTSISIANNSITDLPTELFESTLSLQRLNISHNTLSKFDAVTLSRCKHITELDLSHNQIKTLHVNEILDASPKITTLNAANNLLFTFSDNSEHKYYGLQRLDLSSNDMTVITSNTFHSYKELRYLNVSLNILGNIEQNAFQELNTLQILDLSLNHLKDLSLKLPEGIQHISLAKNQLKFWPIENYPTNLQTIELQDNELTEMFNSAGVTRNRIEFSSLKIINISKNRIKSLPDKLSYPVLEVFDGSFNEFTSIPKYLGAQAPVLQVLRLRGNPIKTIEFSTKISAHIIDLSELPTITEFDANVFNSLEPKADCLELIISKNPNLQNIRNSFDRVPKLCNLDLSYNNLRYINHNWMNWSALHKGADLQGNPIDCTCDSQWILEIFIPAIYKKIENHHYLFELRCATPERFKTHRLVRYLNHTGAFCKPEMAFARFSMYRSLTHQENDEYEFVWYQGFGLWLTIALILIIVSSATAIIVILVRRWHQDRTEMRNNRRYHNGGVL